MKPYLSVIIPAYNEEHRLPSTLKSVLDWLSRQNFLFEVIVVDDGSSDNTAKVVRKIAQHEPRLLVKSYPENRGKGYAVKIGMLKARGKLRLFMDADSATPIWELKKLLPHIKDFEIVIGSRKQLDSKVKPPPRLRKFISYLSGILIKALLDLDIKDSQCGFKLFGEKPALILFNELEIFGWGFDFAILAAAQKRGFKIKEVGVSWQHHKYSKLRAGRAILKTFIELLRVRKALKSNPASKKDVPTVKSLGDRRTYPERQEKQKDKKA